MNGDLGFPPSLSCPIVFLLQREHALETPKFLKKVLFLMNFLKKNVSAQTKRHFKGFKGFLLMEGES